nr:cytochrome c3 family protein [uncultured Desulfuromonas sp.]
MRLFLIVFFVVVCGAPSVWSMDNPHQISRVFRKEHQQEVAPVCQLCHQLTQKLVLDFDVTGEFVPGPFVDSVAPIVNDQVICMKCHVDADKQSVNHPVGMPYDIAGLSRKFHRDPQGIKLYHWQEGDVGRVMCSTCHDPHSEGDWMLRVSLDDSQLCLCCHNY